MRASVADTFRRVAFQRSFAHRSCSHREAVEDRTSMARACPHCEEGGSDWVDLRMCLSCAERSAAAIARQDRHARAHFEATGHPLSARSSPARRGSGAMSDRAYLTSVEA